LVIWGDLDPVIPVKYAESFVSGIKDCRFYRMEGSGHTPYVDNPQKFVSIDGNKVRYLESGDSSETLVLVHGLGASAERWEFVMPSLKEHFKLIVPDLIGFGYSDKPLVDYTPEFFSEFLGKFLKELNISKTHLIGSSLGGQVIAEFAAKTDSIIDKIVLISPSGAMKHSTAALDAYVMAALYPNESGVKNAFEMMSGGSKNIDEKIIDGFVQRMQLPNAKMAFMSTLLGLKNSEVITSRLQSISRPTLVIWGDLDPVIPVKYAESFVSSIKDCRFYRMDGSGHTPYVDNPQKFVEVILEFLR
jgi:pimeloyl-ACP methyl ester carboxylesterase